MKFFRSIFLLAACTAILCTTTPASAQLHTATTIKAGIDLARKEHKPLMVIINVYANAAMPPVRANSKMYESQRLAIIGARFVVAQGSASNPDLLQLVKKYHITSFPTWIFMNTNQEVFYKTDYQETFAAKFTSTLADALKVSKLPSIAELEKDISQHTTDNDWIKNLINRRKRSGAQNNSELIDMYVKNLAIGDLNDYQTVLFILEAGTQLDGYAYRMAFTNKHIVDSIFKKEPIKRRKDLLRIIRENTMDEAIRTKTEKKATLVASELASSWGKDFRNAGISTGNTMLKYYKAVGDTTRFLQRANYLYDGYYMQMSADSIKKIDKKNFDATVSKLQENFDARNKQFGNLKIIGNSKGPLLQQQIDSLKKTNRIVRASGSSQIIGVIPNSNSVAKALNDGAWNVYETNTHNIKYLTKAMIWSRRAIELNPSPSYYDTLAHILYRLSYFEEAEKTQSMAIKLSSGAKSLRDTMQKSLADMKARTL